jgi:hypothetical protein
MLTAAHAAPMPVTTVVVLDACDDGTHDLAGHYGSDVHFISVDAHNVGCARAAGFRYARSLGRTGADCWYATSDADSRVDADWLVRQSAQSADVVLGVLRATDRCGHRADAAERYQRAYHARISADHDHVHWANIGFTATAYWAVGGFRGLATGEDLDLVSRFEAAGYRIVRDGALSVAPSMRTEARAGRLRASPA